MPAAIAVPAIIGAAGVGTSLAGAKMASNAAHDASRQQQDATNRAQAFNERVYADQQRLMNPYQQAGQYALGNLMARQYGGSPNQYAPPQGYGAPMGAQPTQGYSPFMRALQPPQAPQAQPMAPSQGQPGPFSAGLGGGGGMVTVMDDSGAQRQVPAAQGAMYAQRGFRVLPMTR